MPIESIRPGRVTDADAFAAFVAGQHRASFTETVILSAGQMLDLAMSEHERSQVRTVLSLGCAYGTEFLGLRAGLGEGVALWGVDNNRELLSGKNRQELQENLDNSGGTVMIGDYRELDTVLSAVGSKPDLLLALHPPVKKPLREVVGALKPWLQYAAGEKIPMLITFFDEYGEYAAGMEQQIARMGIQVRLLENAAKDRASFYDHYIPHVFYPNTYILRIN